MGAGIVVEVERIRCGHNSRLGVAKVVSGEPHVLAHFEQSTFEALTRALAENGYVFSVRVVDRHVSMVVWYGGV